MQMIYVCIRINNVDVISVIITIIIILSLRLFFLSAKYTLW